MKAFQKSGLHVTPEGILQNHFCTQTCGISLSSLCWSQLLLRRNLPHPDPTSSPQCLKPISQFWCKLFSRTAWMTRQDSVLFKIAPENRVKPLLYFSPWQPGNSAPQSGVSHSNCLPSSLIPVFWCSTSLFSSLCFLIPSFCLDNICKGFLYL